MNAKIYKISFWLTLTVAIMMMVVGFILPPHGQIDPSVLTAVGILFLWPALAFGAKALEEGHKATITHGETTISVSHEE